MGSASWSPGVLLLAARKWLAESGLTRARNCNPLRITNAQQAGVVTTSWLSLRSWTALYSPPIPYAGTVANESLSGAGPDRRETRGIKTNVPHPARVYDYFLGGKDNYEVDRIAADAAIKAFPKTAESARAARAFLRRVVRFLATEAGISQFLDIGTGLPSGENVHQVAQSINPEAKIVYVDNDHCKSSCVHVR